MGLMAERPAGTLPSVFYEGRLALPGCIQRA